VPVQAGLNPVEGKSDIWLYAIPGLCAVRGKRTVLFLVVIVDNCDRDITRNGGAVARERNGFY
jgi:hypothetical protein